MTRAEMRAVMSDQTAVIATVVGEALNEPLEGQAAVACVLRNRARHPRWWGSGWKGVCHAPKQFSCWWEANANTDRVYEVADALMRRLPQGFNTPLSQIQWLVSGVMEDAIMDRTDRSDHYLTTALYRSPGCPAWAKKTAPIMVIGGHTFFRLEL